MASSTNPSHNTELFSSNLDLDTSRDQPLSSYSTQSSEPSHNPPQGLSNNLAAISEQPSSYSPEHQPNAASATQAYHREPADASYNEVELDEYGTPQAPVIELNDKANAAEQSQVPLAPVDNLKYAHTGGETVEDSFEFWETPGGAPGNTLVASIPPAPHPTLRELPASRNVLNNSISVADPPTPQPSPVAVTSTASTTSKPSYETTENEIVPESSYSERPKITTPRSEQPTTTTTQEPVSTSSAEPLTPIVYSSITQSSEVDAPETFKRQAVSSVGPYIGAAPVFSQGPRTPDIWEMFNAEWGQRVRRRSG